MDIAPKVLLIIVPGTGATCLSRLCKGLLQTFFVVLKVNMNIDHFRGGSFLGKIAIQMTCTQMKLTPILIYLSTHLTQGICTKSHMEKTVESEGISMGKSRKPSVGL